MPADADTVIVGNAALRDNVERLFRSIGELREQGMAIQRFIFRGIEYGSPVMSLIYLVIISAILLAAFKFGAGAENAGSTCQLASTGQRTD